MTTFYLTQARYAGLPKKTLAVILDGCLMVGPCRKRLEYVQDIQSKLLFPLAVDTLTARQKYQILNSVGRLIARHTLNQKSNEA